MYKYIRAVPEKVWILVQGCLVHSKAELYVNLTNVLICGSVGKASACRHVKNLISFDGHFFTRSISYDKLTLCISDWSMFFGSSSCRLTQGRVQGLTGTGILARIDFSFLMRLAKVASVKYTRLLTWSRCVTQSCKMRYLYWRLRYMMYDSIWDIMKLISEHTRMWYSKKSKPKKASHSWVFFVSCWGVRYQSRKVNRTGNPPDLVYSLEL